MYSAGNADRQGTRPDFRPQAAAVFHHITIELIRVWVIEADLDLSGLPLVDLVIIARAPSD